MNESDHENAAITTEEDVFEINDFTNASDWETFTAQIEETITNWNLVTYVKLSPLKENELTTGEWESITTNLSFSNVPFTMTMHRLKMKPDSDQVLEKATDEDDDDKLQLPQYVEDMMNISNDFPARAHCIARWYGLRCFLVLSIAQSNGVTSISKCNLLRSSVCIALNNTSCDIPCFVQIQENWRRMFEGKGISSGMSTLFEMVHLRKTPQAYSTLSGLLQVFKAKIGLTSLLSGETRVSARFTYVLNDWGQDGAWPTKIPDPEAVAGHFGTLLSGCFEDPVTELQLACIWPDISGDMIIDNDVHSDFKPYSAPRWSIRLRYADDVSCLLSSYLYEFMKITNRTESMSDLLNVLDGHPSDRGMGHALEKITAPSSQTVIPLVPSKFASSLTKVVTDPHSIIRKSKHAFDRISAVRERIPRETLNDIKSFLFFESDDPSNSNTPQQRRVSSPAYTFYHKLKAAPIDSLTHHLAMCAVVVNLCHGGLSALAQVWHIFVSELRRMLDDGEALPGVDSNSPDLHTCLLHQKLQMLNCCIMRKTRREDRYLSNSSDISGPTTFEFESPALSPSPSNKSIKTLTDSSENVEFTDALDTGNEHIMSDDSPGLPNETQDTNPIEECSVGKASNTEILPSSHRNIFSVQSDDDEEFFECESDVSGLDEDLGEINTKAENLDSEIAQNIDKEFAAGEKENNPVSLEYDTRNEENISDDSYSAEGRLKTYDNLRLLNFDRPLYIPITQDHAPVTEDQLEEQADMFSKLGDTKEGSKVRAKLQSASLKSDMEAFKAANPGCVIGDFLRWYSPRDFEDGELSHRMKISNNLWVSTWNSAKPIPAHRQKRIFDDTKEAEKVLHFLTNLKPADVVQMLLPSCIHEALLVLRVTSETMSECVPSLPLLCNQIESHAAKVFTSWNMYGLVSNQFKPWTTEIRGKVEDILRQLTFAETLIERAKSLQHKFQNLGDKNKVNTFVRKLVEHPEVQLDGAGNGAEGCIIKYYFQCQEKKRHADIQANQLQKNTSEPVEQQVPSLPHLAGREFIIRATNSYPSVFSRKLPHRMYAVLMQNEFRLAAAVSSDTTFF